MKVMTGRGAPMHHSSDEKNIIVQVLLAVLATILSIVCWFQVAG